MAQDRTNVEEAYPGDIIGIHNHGTIKIGDTFTEKEPLKFTGIPNFAPEHFRRVRLNNPLKSKQLEKGLMQLAEEGAMQVFRPLMGSDYILGAVGVLQFEVTMARLKDEYGVDAVYEGVNYAMARWVSCEDPKRLETFEKESRQPGPGRRRQPGLPGRQRMATAICREAVAGDYLYANPRTRLTSVLLSRLRSESPSLRRLRRVLVPSAHVSVFARRISRFILKLPKNTRF